MELEASAADLQPPPAEVNLAEELGKEKQRYPGASTWAPALIKKAIDGFVAWAAEDGDYKNLDYVPNLTVDTIDPAMPEGTITGFMQRRMHALARVQRHFLRVDRDPAFWDVDAPQRPRAATRARGALLVDKFMQDAAQEQAAAADWPSGTNELATDADATPRRAAAGTKGRPNFKSPAAGVDDELAETPLEPSDEPPSDKARHTKADETQQTTPASQAAVSYRRRPPVVYGLFVLRTSVFLPTVDAAKSDAAYVSFHVDLHFMDRHQSVWNALTVDIAVCFARDDHVSRLADFEPAPLVDDSDPDA